MSTYHDVALMRDPPKFLHEWELAGLKAKLNVGDIIGDPKHWLRLPANWTIQPPWMPK